MVDNPNKTDIHIEYVDADYNLTFTNSEMADLFEEYVEKTKIYTMWNENRSITLKEYYGLNRNEKELSLRGGVGDENIVGTFLLKTDLTCTCGCKYSSKSHSADYYKQEMEKDFIESKYRQPTLTDSDDKLEKMYSIESDIIYLGRHGEAKIPDDIMEKFKDVRNEKATTDKSSTKFTEKFNKGFEAKIYCSLNGEFSIKCDNNYNRDKMRTALLQISIEFKTYSDNPDTIYISNTYTSEEGKFSMKFKDEKQMTSFARVLGIEKVDCCDFNKNESTLSFKKDLLPPKADRSKNIQVKIDLDKLDTKENTR